MATATTSVVPLPALTGSSSGAYGGLEAIGQLLTEHVLQNEPVTDWEAFARELLSRKCRPISALGIVNRSA
jgi:hypothetical protein